jgi:hypothetical protein
MTKQEAAALLNVPDTASIDEVRSRFQEMYSDYYIRLTNAPTTALKRVYQRNLEELRTACELFFPGLVMTAPQDLPAAEPVQSIRDGKYPRSTDAKVAAPGRSAADTPSTAPRTGSSSKALNIAVVMAGLFGASALLFGILWSNVSDERRALEAFLASPADEQISYVNQHEKFSPGLAASLSILENGRFAVCNYSDSPIEVTWVISTYRGKDGVLHTFNTKNYPESWSNKHIGAGGRQAITVSAGSEPLWDGSVLTYAMGFLYHDQEIVKGGAWSAVQEGCAKIQN